MICNCGQCYVCRLMASDPWYRAKLGGSAPLRERLKTFARALWRHARDWFRRASKAEQQRRLSICEGCPLRDVQRNRCTQCGCKLEGRILNKILWKSEKCPVGKW